MTSSTTGRQVRAEPETVAQEAQHLMERVVDRDDAALRALYDRFASMLLALSQRILRDRTDAEDVLQEVFFYVWNNSHAYDASRSSVSTWLVLIIRSRSVDRLRSGQARSRAAERSHVRDPEREVHQRGIQSVLRGERHRRIKEVLLSLPEKQREVLELAFYSDLSQNEISLQTGIPLGTVKTRTLLALRKLKRKLRSEIEELL